MTEHRCDTATPAEHEPTAPKNWPELRAIVLYRDGYTCQTCGAPATEADHKWPKSKGGADKLSNLQALCRTCNRSKSDKLFLQHVTTDRLRDAIEHEMRVAADAALRAAQWLDLMGLIEQAGSVPAPTVDEMYHLDGRSCHVWDYSEAFDMLRRLVVGGTDPAVLGALAYLGAHDDFPVYWNDVLDSPVFLGEKRTSLGSLTVDDLARLWEVWNREGRADLVAGAGNLIEMMREESILVVREIESGFVRGPVEVAS